MDNNETHYVSNINWYPGHMAKTRRMLEENIKLIDAVVEILDARIPLSSRNPHFDDIIKSKPRLVILNKADLADNAKTEKWLDFYKKNNIKAICVSCQSGKGINQIIPEIFELAKDKTEKYAQKGVKKSVKVMIIGIPNVGKSTLINRIVGKSAAKTGNRPGVTLSKQWIRLKDGLELLDTPGILPPKLEDRDVALKLAYTGAIKDEIMETELICYSLLENLMKNYPELLIRRYNITEIEGLKGYELLEKIGRKRGCLVSGGEVDMPRAANIVLDDFRNLKIGPVTLDFAEEYYE